jgi:Transposase IS66 family
VPLGRVQQLLADVVALRLGRGTLVSWIQRAAGVLAPMEAQLKAALQRAPALHYDETGVRRAGTLAWAHVRSTSRLNHYARHARHAKRGSEATEVKHPLLEMKAAVAQVCTRAEGHLPWSRCQFPSDPSERVTGPSQAIACTQFLGAPGAGT